MAYNESGAISTERELERMEKLRILIAEDDLLLQEIYDYSLSGHVFDKKIVGNGADALDTYKTWKPDLIMLDSIMPVMTGYSALKEIRTTLHDKTTPVVISTSMSKSEDVLSFAKLGISGYIVKPFDPDEIGAKILSYYEKTHPQAAQEATEMQLGTIEQWHGEWEKMKEHPEEAESATE